MDTERRKMVKARLKKLETQYAKMSSLQKQLEHSLALEELWPEVFKYGACSSHVVSTPVRAALHTGIRDNYSSVFVLKDGRGETRKYSFDNIPSILKMKRYGNAAKKIRIK